MSRLVSIIASVAAFWATTASAQEIESQDDLNRVLVAQAISDALLVVSMAVEIELPDSLSVASAKIGSLQSRYSRVFSPLVVLPNGYRGALIVADAATDGLLADLSQTFQIGRFDAAFCARSGCVLTLHRASPQTVALSMGRLPGFENEAAGVFRDIPASEIIAAFEEVGLSVPGAPIKDASAVQQPEGELLLFEINVETQELLDDLEAQLAAQDPAFVEITRVSGGTMLQASTEKNMVMVMMYNEGAQSTSIVFNRVALE